jgi:very-short-patch-repair endonuclease
MKPLKWITDREKSEYMKAMKDINLFKCQTNKNENKVWSELGDGWSRQAVRGYRIHDFWNHRLGCAIEVDGAEHDRDYDNYRDEYNFRGSGVVILRVRNGNQEDIIEVLRVLPLMNDHATRKARMGILSNTKEGRRVLSALPYDKNKLMFVEFLAKEYNHSPYWC